MKKSILAAGLLCFIQLNIIGWYIHEARDIHIDFLNHPLAAGAGEIVQCFRAGDVAGDGIKGRYRDFRTEDYGPSAPDLGDNLFWHSTPTPSPTPVPLTTSSMVGLVFDETACYSTRDGITRFSGGKANGWYFNLPVAALPDFTIKGLARWDGGKTDNGFGIVFRFRDRRNFYLFEITPGGGGYLMLTKVAHGRAETSRWQKTAWIHPGFNQLRVVCGGTSTWCYINGMQVIHYLDVPPSSAKLKVGIGAHYGVQCSFMDFELGVNPIR